MTHWSPRHCLLLLPVALASLACSQQPANPWTGSWGSFERVPKEGRRAAYDRGQGLIISACGTEECSISLQVVGSTSHAEAKGDLTMESATRAVAHLGVPDKCTLLLQRTAGAHPEIAIHSGSGDCSWFETPGASFEHTYPLRSRTPFVSELFLPDCFVGDSPAQSALCLSPVLAQQEQDWISLLWSVSDLGHSHLDMHTEREKLLKTCDAASDAAKCMATAFQESCDALRARAAAWKASVTEPGDSHKAEQAISLIAGSYRHSFSNGDVQGNSFPSTDTLNIRRASDDSIRYDVYLEFFNGHECSRSGVAKYRMNGSFVDQTQVEMPDRPSGLCAFEIIPQPDGVRFRDANGMCKMESCGERGGYNGQGFQFSDRVRAASTDQKTRISSSDADHPNRRR